MPPETAEPPRAGSSPPDSAVAPHHLGGLPPPLAGPLSGKPRHGPEPVPDTEDDARTPGSAEFFLGCTNVDDDTALPRTAFTNEQKLQWKAQVYVSGDLSVGKPLAEHTMVHAFGGPEGQKNVWQEVWRAAVDRWESQKSLVPGYDTPPSSSLIGSCTSESNDTTVCKTVISDGDEESSQGLDVGSARGLPEKTTEHTELLKQQNGEEAVIISEPKQHAGGEEARQGVDVGSARSHPTKNTTEHTEMLEQKSGDEDHLAVSCAEETTNDKGPDFGSYRNHLAESTINKVDQVISACGGKQSLLDSCFKCGKHGQLLKCHSCPIHVSCFGPFGSSVRLNDGQFCCPFCFCFKATEAHKKAKKTLSEATEAHKKAEKTLSEATKHLSAFLLVKPFAEQHCEQSTGNQQLSGKDEEPDHEKRNDASDACPETVVTEKTTTFGLNPEDAEAHEVGNISSCHEVPHSSQNSFSPATANRSIEADKEKGLTKSPMTRSHRVRFQESETVVSHSYGKSSGRRDQFMHSPARRRYYPYPPECHSGPGTPAARRTLASSRRHGASTGRRKKTSWTSAEEAAILDPTAEKEGKGTVLFTVGSQSN